MTIRDWLNKPDHSIGEWKSLPPLKDQDPCELIGRQGVVGVTLVASGNGGWRAHLWEVSSPAPSIGIVNVYADHDADNLSTILTRHVDELLEFAETRLRMASAMRLWQWLETPDHVIGEWTHSAEGSEFLFTNPAGCTVTKRENGRESWNTLVFSFRDLPHWRLETNIAVSNQRLHSPAEDFARLMSRELDNLQRAAESLRGRQ